MPDSERDLEHLYVVAKRQRTLGSPQPSSSSIPSKVVSESRTDLTHIESTRNTRSEMASSSQTRPLKGRKRFMADLKDATGICLQQGLDVQGLMVGVFESGDDEGSILCEVVKSLDRERVLLVTMLVTDTSEYPNNHSWLCFAQDEEVLSPEILDVIQSASDAGSRPIMDMVNRLLASLAKKLFAIKTDSTVEGGLSDSDHDSVMEEDDDSTYSDHTDDEHFGQTAALNAGVDFNLTSMKRDFNEAIAMGYRPGLTRIGVSEMALSVSLPTFRLASSIAPRALMAWDPRLLSKSRHLTLVISGIRGAYPVLSPSGHLSSNALSHGTSGLQFKVGLTSRYKPNADEIADLIRTFTIVDQQSPRIDVGPDGLWGTELDLEDEDITEDDDAFVFSLSAALESLMNDRFLEIVQLRVKHSIGWAAAEALLSKVHRLQRNADDILVDHSMEILEADGEEEELSASYTLPPDPFALPETIDELNLPLLAFSYLLRRLTLCPRYCLVCYDKIKTDFEALKPYVCSDKLCTYQYYSLNRGPSLEYEICSKPQTVDLLVSLTYIAAVEGGLRDFPDGMNLQVIPQGQKDICEFDQLSVEKKRSVIAALINTLPPIADMKRVLMRKNKKGQPKLRLQDVYAVVSPAAWSILRWSVASCTAHIEELVEESDQVIGIGQGFRQFRFTVGAPDAEAKFLAAQNKATQEDANARMYPSLFGFHGSPAKNWHSIIRHGLWFKDIAHGRAHGNGVYFAKDANYSITGYARHATSGWMQSEIQVRSCLALAEIVNLPSQFTHTNATMFVVPNTDWIVCRYLLVSGAVPSVPPADEAANYDPPPCIPIDPKHPLTMSTASNPSQVRISIPETSHKLDQLLARRQNEYVEEAVDDEDLSVLEHVGEPPSQPEPLVEEMLPVEDDWEHDSDWVAQCVQYMLPPPVDATPMAVSSVQRELATMLKEQEKARSLQELGWYMPPDFVGDNLFQWIVELHSFEPALPVARDMVARGVNSLVFEIRFPPNFPHSPPFFRILKPRFLPFIQGGGGHITGGGSMCMDLLTADGWLPSYSIAAVLLQIKLAISNLDPRPARLASNWDTPYTMQEAVVGYKRAATTHGWRVPDTLNRM